MTTPDYIAAAYVVNLLIWFIRAECGQFYSEPVRWDQD